MLAGGHGWWGYPLPASDTKMTHAIRRAGTAMRIALALGALIALHAPTARAEQIVSARYAEPVERYGHYALGKPHEYARVVAKTDAGSEVVLELPADEVFEDLAPRLVRLSAGAQAELLVVVSARGSGSRLALVGLASGRLEIVARSAAIGTPNRWLNPVGVADLDGDGTAEIAAVTTPHIGGVLRVYRRSDARLVEISSLDGFSNHVYGSAELGLSKPALIAGRMQLLVPDAQRASVRVIALSGVSLVETGRCPLPAPITGPPALRVCEARLSSASSARRRWMATSRRARVAVSRSPDGRGTGHGHYAKGDQPTRMTRRAREQECQAA